MPEIEKLYSVVKDNGLYTKSYDEFVGKYSDEKNISKLYRVVYDQGLYTKSFDDFKGKYFTQVKKKESVSPSQQSQPATSSATGAMAPDGAPAPSARKRYDVKGKPTQPVISAAPAAQLTEKDLDMMMPFRGGVQETIVVDQPPTMKEKLQSEVDLSARALFNSMKPGYTPVSEEAAQKAWYGKANVEPGTLRGVPGETKSTVSNLNDKYKNLGVQFKETPSKIQKSFGLGDIVVTADDGSTHIVQSVGSDEKLREEEAKLQRFLMGKSGGAEKKDVTPMEFLMMSRDGVSPQEESKFKRVYTQEMVDNSIKFANDELGKTKDSLSEINSQIAQLNKEAEAISEIVATSGVTPEIEDQYNSITQKYESLKSQYSEKQKQAMSMGALVDEGVRKAAAENARLMSDQGNIPGALYNSLLKGAKDLAGGAFAFSNKALSVANIIPSDVKIWDEKKAREEYTSTLNKVYDNLKVEDISKEYTTEGNLAWKALFSVPEFIPSLLVPGGVIARISAMTAQGTQRRLEEMDANPMMKNASENEKFFMAAVPALVEAKLENYGLTQWLGTNKAIASSIALNAISKVLPSAGAKGLNRIINAEINNLVLRGAVNTAGAMAIEFETGALQNISDTWFRDAYEIAKGKDIFKQPGFTDEGFKEALLQDAILEGLGGMWMAGAVNIAQQTDAFVTGKKNTNETFKLVREILANNTTEMSLISTLKSQMVQGKLSKETAIQTISNFREAKAIARDLPEGLSEDNQRAAFDLLAEKRKLTKQIEGKDPSLVNKQKKRIAIIDNELIDISNAVQEQTTSEVPVQPETRDGEEVVEGKPQPEPQVFAEEGKVAKEEIATRQSETESKIKRKDLFDGVGTFSRQLGGSDVDAVPVSHSENNGIEFVQYANPNTGSIDVIVTGTSENDYVGFYRIYENRKPTNKWSSKFENQSRNKENFKTMISGVQSMLPNNHEYTEKTSISTDGLRVWNQQLGRGYELQFDDNGNVVTSEVAINGDAIVNELGIDVVPGNFENISVTTIDQFDKARKAILPYLESMGLYASNIKWENGTVKIDLPVLKKSSVAQAEAGVTPGRKAIVSGVEITYPTQEQRAERETVRNSQEYVNARSIELPVTDVQTLAEDLDGDFAMVTGENPEGQPLTEEENQALNQKAQEWLTGRGYDPKPIVGKFNQAENSFFVKGMTEADAIEFAQEFNQESVAHSGGMLYQDGSRNPRTTGDDFTFKNFEPGVDMVSVVNTTDGPKQFSVAYDFKATIQPESSNFDQALANSAQSLNVVAPGLKVIVGENIDDVQNQIVEALAPLVGERQAVQTAEEFATGTKGQTIFVDGKPFAVVFDKTTADSRTAGHEAWEVMLSDAFGNDQAKFKEFTVGIDSQLRAQGFNEIADALDAFASQKGYEAVKYSEYMAELGGMLVESGFGKGPLTAQQKTLLQKIGDIINKFAELFTGKKQFLDQATPEDILGFMVTISNKVAKGEDVASFFRKGEKAKATEGVTSKSQMQAIEILDGPKFDNKLKEDVAFYLNGLRDSEIPPNSSRELLMERFINNVYEEVGYYLYSKPDARSAGLTWYIEDMVEFENKIKVVLPELSNENQYKLFLTVLAFTSSGTNPNQNLLYAYNLWNNSKDPKNFEFSKTWGESKLSFIDKKGKSIASGIIVKETAKEYTVELIDSLGRPVVDKKGNKKYEKISKNSMKEGYPKSTGYTNRGEIIIGQLEKLEKIYKDLGSIDKVVKWLESPHPISELRKYNQSVPDVNGKGPGETNKEYDPKKNAEGERNGAFIFGEKIGSFYQNMIGIGETITMDLWWSRTWNRYMGTMINTVSGKKEIQEVPRSDRERNIMREAVKLVAEDLNLQVSELQAAIWYFEQELWAKSGNKSPSYSYVTAIDDLTKKLKVDEETRTKLRAAEADLTEAEKRRQNAAERAAAVVASKGGKIPGAKVDSRSQKAFDENIKKEESDVKLKYNNNGQILAPNGKPSNLPESLARYTRTTVFKDWFGDWEKDPKNSSKVVDENGEPLVVYHGSPYGGITSFDRKESAKISSGLKEFGTYFTTNQNVAEIYSSEGKISPEKVSEINRQINKLEQARDNTRNSNDYYNLEKEIEALKKSKSPKVYSAFLSLKNLKDFNAEKKSFPEAWRSLKVDAGYKTATDRDAMDFLREGKFGVKKVDGIKASNIVDIVSQGKKDNDFVGDVYLVFDNAPDAIRIAETPTVKSRSQKNVPPVVDEVLTDDGKGNYLFVHYSDENRDVIKPMSGSKSNFTSREEVSAISAVGGVAMYYTKAGQKESGVGDVPHTVLVPKDKVYFYGSTEKGTVSHDPEGFEEEARQRFQAYRNRGNEDRPTKYAFDANNSAAWVTKVAGENGYDMVVTNWGGPKSYRAQTTKALKPEAEYTGFKKPEPVVFEVGDEVSLYGRYATIVAVDGDVLTYESPNAFGRFDTGKFPLSPYTSYKITMIEKAKPSVTTRSQKVEVKTIPGYDRMMNEVEGIMDKTINRGGSYNQASANAINYIQKSASYERADDIQREQIIRDFKKIRGEKFKVAPSVAKILGQIEDVKKITVKESTALKDQIKLEAKAAKDSAAFVKQLRMDISGRLKSMVGRGMMSARQATAIISRYDKMNILNPVMRDRFVDYMSRVFQSAEYMDKIKEASKLRASIKKNMKSAANQAEIAKLAKDFGDIDPSRVEDIDDYINNATQMLNAVARKTGDPLMRSLVNAADMASYIETEIDLQVEQIKNEILDKYKELVDAGVLSGDMTINEIKKVVAAIEENDNEAVAKEEKARAAVKEMMEEVSPLILQIVKTGEDPFTGEPITLTQDEKRSLVALAKMDTDNLSLSSAIQVLEYANNFVANGITSGIDGMVSLYQGDLNAGDLVDDGIKSIPLSKYFSKAVGRVWGEGFATLPMLNKLLWGNTRRAIMVSDKAGINGVSNGKAKALKMVNTAVKQYVKLFSKTKDFLASENVVERGIFAFMSRNVIGDEFQAQDEFNRRKSLIEETIQALTDVDNNTDAEIKKGEVVQKVYDKVLKDAKNIDDVKKNVSQINQDAVNWWINKWSENFDRLDEVSRNVYNTQLSRDIDFTPDRFQLKEAPTAVEEDFDSGFFGNFEYVDTSKSGSLKKNNRISNLPKDKNGVKTRIVNLDFDVNNVNAFTNAMVDVETASSVMQMKGFVTSKNFSKLFSNKEDKNFYKKRLIKYVNRAKGGSYIDQNELTKINRVINTIASFGVAKALFSVAQPFKQFFPPMINTFVQTGRFDLSKLLYGGGMSFIDSSGYPIANRGVASQGELKSINRQLVEAEKNLAMRGLDGIAELSNKALEITLKNPDILAARASWLSFYLSKLKKDGVNISGIDFKNHELNKDAADYAQAMVDSQQNISDTDMQGEIFASKQPATVFLRRAILPLMTFTLNQKTRIWSDIRTLSNDVSSKDDKMEAAKSLSGALIELVAFQGIALAFKELYNVVAAAIMGEDEDEEEKKIRKMRQAQATAQAFMKDFFLPPIPGMDIAASKGINYLLDETGLSDELPYKWYGIEDEEQKFRLYDKMNQGYLDMLGTQGIAAEKGLQLIDYYDAAIDGEFTKEYNGNKVKKALMEEDLDIARMNAVIMTAYYGGLLPSDMANIVNIMNKKIQKRAEQVDED